MDAKGRRLRVLMMPDYRRDNPYQSLLAASLSGLGIDVLFPVGYRRGLPFWRATRDNRPIDVLHLHWTEPYTRNGHWPSLIFRWSKLLVDLAIVRISGVRVVWTLHNLEPHECRCPRLERFFRRRLAGRVSRLLVHGDESRIAGEMALGCPPEKMTVTLHGNYRTVYPVATPEMRREGRSGLASDHRVFLFFGMMRPYKGLERLLRRLAKTRAATGDSASGGTLSRSELRENAARACGRNARCDARLRICRWGTGLTPVRRRRCCRASL